MSASSVDIADLPRKDDLFAGKYQIEEVLGKGGMGVVLAARHTGLHQRVAIKFLLPASLRVPGAHERFFREARAAAAIRSEHVARVLDVGTLESGAPYLVMEYLSGNDLAQLLKIRGTLPITEAVDIILQACEAIAEAHALGIVHRDLKPQNLFLDTDAGGSPRVKVLDFGLSKMPAGTMGDSPMASLTAVDVIAGSPHYMSPEQIHGLKFADARADIWALGVILYRLLTGHRPYDGESMAQVALNIISSTAEPVTFHRRGVPPVLDALIQRCLEKDLARRVQTVAELARGLAPFGSPRVVLALGKLISGPSGAQLSHTLEETTLQFKGSSPLAAAADPTPSPLEAQKSSPPQPQRRATIFMVAGGAMAVVGLVSLVMTLLSRAEMSAAMAQPAVNTTSPDKEAIAASPAPPPPVSTPPAPIAQETRSTPAPPVNQTPKPTFRPAPKPTGNPLNEWR